MVALERELVITTGCLMAEDLEKKLKKKRKRLHGEFTVKKKGDNDDDELDNNDNRDSKGNIIPTFKTARDCTLNQVSEGTYDLKELWEGGVRDELPTAQSSDDDSDSNDEDRKEADAMLNQNYSNTESVVNREMDWPWIKKKKTRAFLQTFLTTSAG